MANHTPAIKQLLPRVSRKRYAGRVGEFGARQTFRINPLLFSPATSHEAASIYLKIKELEMSTPHDDCIPTSDATKPQSKEAQPITNMKKYENYKNQFQRLNRAMLNHFYLEAIAIEYAIMEDRAEAILRYEGNEIIPKNEREFISFAKKKNKIVKIAENKKTLMNRYFSDNLMDEIMTWINHARNPLTHALLKRLTTSEELKNFAKRGRDLCKTLSNRANNYKRMVERKTSKAQDEVQH
ncbi:MAG: hypothetical protein IJ268_05815 [Proteobacteria bacterium]|nr:hypothetical protein [Pseudomonadota bacterium]